MNRVQEVLDIVKRAKSLGDYDSNVIGMAAEIIAEDEFGMSKSPTGAKDIDGYWYRNNNKVSIQVKAFSSGRVQRYKGSTKFRIKENGSDHLLVILFYSDICEYEVLYSGPPSKIGKIENGKNTRIITLNSIKEKLEIEKILAKISN